MIPEEMKICRAAMEEMEAVFNEEKQRDYDGSHLFSDWQVGFGDGLAFSLMAIDRPYLVAELLASLLEELIELKRFRDSVA